MDLEKYSQLVEEDEQTVDHEYASAYRGKVQNRKVDDELMPMFILSYRQYSNGVKSYVAFDEQVEAFNSTLSPQQRINITCNPKTLSVEETRTYFATIDKLSAAIQDTKDLNKDKNLLLQRAVAYTVTQNFDDAINDLTAYLQIDSLSSLAYWQRAACQSMMNEFSASQGMDTRLKSVRTLADLDAALSLNPQNPYIYYDRANVHAQQKDYVKAIDDYTKALKIDPNIAEAYYNRGLARIHSGNKNEGIEDLSKAGELGLYEAYGIIKKYRGK